MARSRRFSFSRDGQAPSASVATGGVRPPRPKRNLTGALAGSLVLAAACSPGAATDASSHRFAVTVEDGVEVASTTGGPKYEGEIFTYEKVLTIRPDPEVPESYIGYVNFMTMADDGTIFASDMQAGRVVAFAPDGSFLRTFGRRGQGPGEFRSPALLEVVDGVLWAEDLVAQRSHSFALDGTFLRTVTIPERARAEHGLIDGLWWILADGRIAVFKLGTRRDEEHNYLRAEMLVIDEEGTLARAETPWLAQTERLHAADRSEAMPVDLQFRGFPGGQYSRRHGFFLMSSDQPEVRVYDLDGGLTRILRIDLPPRPVGSEDRARVEQRLEEELQRALHPDPSTRSRPNPERARFARDHPRYADPKDYWQSVFVDDKGFVWLEPIGEDGRLQSGPPVRYLILSPQGEYLGSTLAPGWQFQRGHVLTTEEDPVSGERFPVVYRIRPAVEGLEY